MFSRTWEFFSSYIGLCITLLFITCFDDMKYPVMYFCIVASLGLVTYLCITYLSKCLSLTCAIRRNAHNFAACIIHVFIRHVVDILRLYLPSTCSISKTVNYFVLHKFSTGSKISCCSFQQFLSYVIAARGGAGLISVMITYFFC